MSSHLFECQQDSQIRLAPRLTRLICGFFGCVTVNLQDTAMEFDQFLHESAYLYRIAYNILTLIRARPIPVPSYDLLTDCTLWKRSPTRPMSDFGIPTPESFTSMITSVVL